MRTPEQLALLTEPEGAVSSHTRTLTLWGPAAWANATLPGLSIFPAVHTLWVRVQYGYICKSARGVVCGILSTVVTLFIHKGFFNGIHELQLLVSFAPCLTRLSVVLYECNIGSGHVSDSAKLPSAPSGIEDLSLCIYNTAIQEKFLRWIPPDGITSLCLYQYREFKSPQTLEYISSIGPSLLRLRMPLPIPDGKQSKKLQLCQL